MTVTKRIVGALATGAAVAALVLTSATGASAITTTSCGSRTDFLKLVSTTATCFASPGVMSYSKTGVQTMSSGVNYVGINRSGLGWSYYGAGYGVCWGKSYYVYQEYIR